MESLTHVGEDVPSGRRVVAWPWVVVDVLEALSEAHPESGLEELAHRADEAARAGDRARAADWARRAARQALDLLARDVAARGEPERDVECIFRREGEYWAVGREGALVRLRDSIGLHHLAELLQSPGRDLAAVDLVARHVHGHLSQGDAGEVLDARAKGEYRRRIEDLRDELEEAERFGDLGRSARARGQIELLAAELARAVGLGGRSRRVGSLAERARVNVTRTIREAMRRIAELDAGVGRHLETTIRTGTYCCYTPDPDTSVRWRL
jgi:hypothetical protein